MTRFLFVALLSICPLVDAAEDDEDFDVKEWEFWECFESSAYALYEAEKRLGRTFSERPPVLVKLGRKRTSDEESRDLLSGFVRFAENVTFGKFQITGLDRRWDWDIQSDASYEYSFVIEPNGDGSYYDFSRVESGESAQPSQLYQCKLAK